MSEERRRILFIGVLLLSLLSIVSHAAAAPSITVNTLSERTFLKDGWKYFFGDDPSFALNGINDQSWKTVSMPQSAFPLDQKKSGYVWLRLTFGISASLSSQAAGIYMNKLPDAAEIYCNGSLIGTSGSMPSEGFFGTDNIPRSFLIPQGILNYNGDNVLAIRIYSERSRLDLKDIFFTTNADRTATAQFELFFNSQMGMIITLLSIFTALFFFIMFIRQREERFNLFLVLGSLFFGIYYTSLYLESGPVSYILMRKIQMVGMYIGITFYTFFFQDFFRYHSKKIVKIIIGSISGLAVVAIFIAPDFKSIVFLNDTVFYIFLMVPLLFYIFAICIVQLLRKKSYALLFFMGISVVIVTGLYDMVYAVLGLQPRFWLNGWGMMFFLIAIFLNSASRFMDIKISAEKESMALVEKTRQQMELLEDIREIGHTIAASGDILSGSILDAESTVHQVVTSNSDIEGSIHSHIQELRINNDTISDVLSSFEQISHFVSEQAALVEQSSSSITELAASISKVSETTIKAKDITDTLSRDAGKGREAVESAAIAINEINESSNAVREIVNLIGNIALTINLLGMNASIEAAHAGQFGRGFAVVANEIRKLAEETSSSSKLIMQQIESMVAKTTNGLEKFDEVREELGHILDGIKATDDYITHITQAAGEQDTGARELLSSVQSMLGATENVKTHSTRQKTDTEKIRQAISGIEEIFHSVQTSTEQLSSGGNHISEIIENIRSVSDEHRAIQKKLEDLLESYV